MRGPGAEGPGVESRVIMRQSVNKSPCYKKKKKDAEGITRLTWI